MHEDEDDKKLGFSSNMIIKVKISYSLVKNLLSIL